MKFLAIGILNFSIWFQTAHPEVHKKYEDEINLTPSKGSKRSQKPRGQGKLLLSQNEFDEILTNLVIDGMLPLSFTSCLAFKEFVHSKLNMIFFQFIHVSVSCFDFQ